MKVSSVLILAAVPAALAIGGLYWLTFGERVHGDIRAMSQEDRAALTVHAMPRPKKTIQVMVGTRQSHELAVEVTDQDGGELKAYVRNISHRCVPFVQLHYAAAAPDGTVIASDSKYQNDATAGILSGQRIEISFDNVPTDDRISTIDVWASAEHYDCQ